MEVAEELSVSGVRVWGVFGSWCDVLSVGVLLFVVLFNDKVL